MKNNKIQLSKNIKKYRLMKKMSQSDLSKRIGVSHQAISKWETGENYPDFMSLISLAQLFEVSLDILVYQ
ncbi:MULTISPECIES: helix-turn-helix domain-containing protein [Streptococcus]|uniref:DNA-binding protein n=1 Tax=Streptococcus gallolyticus TaxID=315405 RepID=A0AA94SAP0_9STRE|nr:MULTISPECIES: helix-turn-helix transcriptional regulator [Streptococcus]AQP43130.1 DNA-binding protein [Streptococcus gallolyticus subsp. gallolyticus DSM 16831]MCF1634690.1 helix-turn-helix domain-containing protein [Streptococcus gallolyticus]MCR5053063.1 helix-turn-helix domain-containing protein [Streptococcus sp.]MCY7192059.1 helix-turn-helix domain-containing protein [Streptococcus gallolyticus subsp. gallolyticus]WAW98782.1 helix-turn-helix transcriptional regulator [Streptococcus ga